MIRFRFNQSHHLIWDNEACSFFFFFFVWCCALTHYLPIFLSARYSSHLPARYIPPPPARRRILLSLFETFSCLYLFGIPFS
ncbi:hypothetical protein BDW02DRAFT_394791 [Decorospora gaudefroyi]|uniref:Uncharacterized protein n=1 Tax=Decorospora gaudefroyi TaxID=184978 RepID=A0A6A5KDL8_9PLEO|nr:hypothetical protein BDW02DRAFT_394791 [Decorospora gaudefroyi]